MKIKYFLYIENRETFFVHFYFQLHARMIENRQPYSSIQRFSSTIYCSDISAVYTLYMYVRGKSLSGHFKKYLQKFRV